MTEQKQEKVELQKITQSDINYFFMVLVNSVEMAEDGQWKDPAPVSMNFNAIKKEIVEKYHTSPDVYTTEELVALGFRKVSADSDLYLVPIWFYDLIPAGTLLVHKESSDVFTKGSRDLPDTTHEFGLISYGVIKK
jgi:hypothetical protein